MTPTLIKFKNVHGTDYWINLNKLEYAFMNDTPNKYTKAVRFRCGENALVETEVNEKTAKDLATSLQYFMC